MTPRAAASTATPPGPSPLEASLAEALGAVAIERVAGVLPSSGRAVTVPGYVRRERVWRGELPPNFGAVPNKLAFTHDGTARYPELIVVQLLEAAGWEAAWRKNWKTEAYWREIGVEVEPSPLALAIIEQVSRQAGHAPPWDIVAWRGRELRLLTSRTGGGQRMGAYLASWLDAALRMGIPLGCFAIVEHRSDRRRASRARAHS
jgi:hypothetical protein